jgi:ATP-dependent Zn protease
MKLNIENKPKFNLIYALIAFGLILLLQNFLTEYQATERLPYSKFLELVESGGVEDVVVKESMVEGGLKEPINGHNRFVTTRVDAEVARTWPGTVSSSAVALSRRFFRPCCLTSCRRCFSWVSGSC